MKRFITLSQVLILLMASLASMGPVAMAATKGSACENGECVPGMIDRLQDLGSLYKAQCLPKNIRHDDIAKYHQETPFSEECWKLITEINHLENELQKHASRLESRLGCESGNCTLSKPTESINGQLNALARVEENLSCTETKKTAIRNQCPADMNCVLTSTALSAGGYLAELLVPTGAKPKGCHLGNDGCATQLVTAFIKSAVTFFEGAWDLLKIIGRKSGKKMTEFWNWVSGGEDHSSTAQLAMAKASEDPGIFDQLVKDFSGTMKKIWGAFVASMKEWFKADVFCQKWSGAPHFSKCLMPTNNFDCLPCKTFVTGLCSFSGTLIAEIVPAFLTGGLTSAVKLGVQGASKISKVFKISEKSLAKIKATRIGRVTTAASGKVDDTLKVSRGLKAAKTVITSALAGIKTYMLSPARKALKASYTAISAAVKKGAVQVAATKTGKVIIFSGKALKKMTGFIIYPIDNPLTVLAFNKGARSLERAVLLGKPSLAAQTAVTSSITLRMPELDVLMARIDETKLATKPSPQKILKLETELLEKIKTIRAEAGTNALFKNDVEFNEVIKRLYPELQYGALAKSLPSADVIKAEKELYLQISTIPNAAQKEKLLTRYQQYMAHNEKRSLVVGNSKSLFDPDIKPIQKTTAQDNFDRPLSADELAQRHALRNYMKEGHDELLLKAKETERVIKNSRSPVVYDTVAIGAGPNTGVAVSAIKETNPNLRVLVIESTENLGTFHRVKAFDINSAEWIGNSGNTFPTSSVQVRDFNLTNSSFATAEEVGHVTQANFQVADVDLIFNNALAKWTKEPTPGAWPAKYKVETTKGNIVYTHSGILTPGLGAPVTRLKDPASISLVSKYEEEARAINLAVDATYIPRFQSVEDFLALSFKDSQLNRMPVGRYEGKKLLLVGDGDGGSIGAEVAAGLNREMNPRNLKTKVNVVWLGQEASTGKEFISKLSKWKVPRYSRIGGAIDNGSINTVDGYLSRIEEFISETGEKKIKAFYTTKKGEAIGEPLVVDNVVFATGYTHSLNTVAPFFKTLAEKQNIAGDEVLFTPLKGKVNEYTRYDQMRTQTDGEINKQLVVNGSKEDIYVIGVGSKTPISKRKMKTVTGGFLDLTGPRAAATGRILAERLAPQRLTKPQMQILLTPAKGKTLEFIKQPDQLSLTVAPLANTRIADIHTKIELGRSLKFVKSSPNSTFGLKITKKGDQIVYVVSGLDHSSAQKIVDALSNNPQLTRGINEEMRLGRTTLEVGLSTRASGAVKLEELVFQAETLAQRKVLDPPMNLSGAATKIMSPTLRTAENSEDQD